MKFHTEHYPPSWQISKSSNPIGVTKRLSSSKYTDTPDRVSHI